MTKVWLPLVPLRAAFVSKLISLSYQTVTLGCPGTLIIPKAAGKSIASANSWTHWPFSILFPLELRKPHCFQSIPKSWAPKAYLLWVQMLQFCPWLGCRSVWVHTILARSSQKQRCNFSYSVRVYIACSAHLHCHLLNKNRQWTMRSQHSSKEFPSDHHEESIRKWSISVRLCEGLCG